MKIIIINGPNLNLLGKRQPELYGYKDFNEYLKDVQRSFPDIQIEYFQSNHEGELIDKIHDAGFSFDGIILNAGGYSHTSIALGDAVGAIKTKVIEVHITNIYAREDFRKISYISQNCYAVVAGLGLKGYEVAIKGFIDLIKDDN